MHQHAYIYGNSFPDPQLSYIFFLQLSGSSENKTVSLSHIPFHSLPSPALEKHLSLTQPKSYYDTLPRM